MPHVNDVAGSSNGGQVKEQESQFAERLSEEDAEGEFGRTAENVQGIHIEEEVHEVTMNKPVGNEPIDFSSFFHRRGHEQHISAQLRIVESHVRDDASNGNDDKGHIRRFG
jgi:hypothetical protein